MGRTPGRREPDTIRQIKARYDAAEHLLHTTNSAVSLEAEFLSIQAEATAAGWEEGWIKSELQLIGALSERGERATGHRKLDELSKYLLKHPNPEVRRWADYLNAEFHFFQGKLDDAFNEASKCLEDAVVNKDTYLEATVAHLIGMIAVRFGADDDALNHYQRSLSIAQTSGFLRMSSITAYQLSELFLVRGQFKYAEKYARACLHSREELPNPAELLRARLRLLSVMIEMENVAEAKALLDQVRDQKDALLEVDRGTLLVCEAKITSQRGDTEAAIALCLKAARFFAGLSKPRLEANAYTNLAEFALTSGDGKRLATYARKIESIAGAIGDEYHTTQAYRLLYECAKLQKRPAAALEYLEKYNARNEKQNQDLLESRLKYLELQAEHEMKRKELEQVQGAAATLKIELDYKEKELTEKTRHLIKQTEALTQFRDDLRAIIRRSPADDPLVKDIKERMNAVPESQVRWEAFDEQFQSVHPEFLNNLTEKHPTLTKTERKICALLRLGLTSVDIAKLLFLSERSVENHRYRIRARIGLSSEKSLHEYIFKL